VRLRRGLPRCSRCGLATIAVLGVFTLLMNSWEVDLRSKNFHKLVEGAERAWATGPAHGAIQDLAKSTMVHHHKWKDWAIIFVHIPRTGGDSMMTHLVATDDAFRGGKWWGKTHIPDLMEELRQLGHLDWYNPSRYPLYEGFFSGKDIVALKNGPWKDHWSKVKVFTILRDPKERLLSSISWFQRNNISLYGTAVLDFLVPKTLGPQFAYVEEKVKTYLRNSMAFQLGEELNSTKRRSLAPQAVASAKELLSQMDYIGFYEDWAEDYYALYDSILRKFEEEQDGIVFWRSWLASFRRFLFYIGALVCRPRMVTRKLFAQVTDLEELYYVMLLTQYDQKVYDFARTLAGRPLDPFYKNYNVFLEKEGLQFASAFVCIIIFVGGCLRISVFFIVHRCCPALQNLMMRGRTAHHKE